MNHSDGPTRAEFERLYQRIDAGFKGIDDRLDTLNGRTRKVENSDTELQVKLKNLEHEVFRRRSTDRKDRDDDTDEGQSRKLLTKRETALVAAGIAILGALFKLTTLLGGLVIDLVKKATHG